LLATRLKECRVLGGESPGKAHPFSSAEFSPEGSSLCMTNGAGAGQADIFGVPRRAPISTSSSTGRRPLAAESFSLISTKKTIDRPGGDEEENALVRCWRCSAGGPRPAARGRNPPVPTVSVSSPMSSVSSPSRNVERLFVMVVDMRRADRQPQGAWVYSIKAYAPWVLGSPGLHDHRHPRGAVDRPALLRQPAPPLRRSSCHHSSADVHAFRNDRNGSEFDQRAPVVAAARHPAHPQRSGDEVAGLLPGSVQCPAVRRRDWTVTALAAGPAPFHLVGHSFRRSGGVGPCGSRHRNESAA